MPEINISALANAKRDAFSISRAVLDPAYSTLIDRLSMAGHSKSNIQSAMIYLLAIELSGLITAVMINKENSLITLDIAYKGMRDAITYQFEETPPT